MTSVKAIHRADPTIKTHNSSEPFVNSLRLQFPRLAAIVLLLWLFGPGAALAQACAPTTHLLCNEAAIEVAPARGELRQDEAPPTQVAINGAIRAAVADPPLSPESGLARTSAKAIGVRRTGRIPILFLRLTL